MRKFTWAAIALIAVAGSAQAGKLSYSYAEAGVGVIDVDDLDSGDGYFVGGSIGFGQNWLAFAEYDMGKFDESGVSADVDDFTIGFGAHFPMTDSVDFVGKLAYVDESVSIDTPIGNADASDSGYKLSAGVRGHAMERLEFGAALEYVDFGDAGDDTGFALAGQYAFTDMFSLGARTRFTDNVTEYGIYGRFTF